MSQIQLTGQLNALKTSWNQVQEEHYDQASSTSSESAITDGPSFLCGIVSPIGMSELLASLPGKSVIDKLLERFFDEEDFLVPSLRKTSHPLIYFWYD
jgi:hypothetical protein